MNNASLETTLKELRLSGLCQTLGVRLQEAAANRLGHAEFLELILQDELNVRQQRLMEEWGKLLCDVPTAGAIIDRFLHHAQVIAITGKSYRVKEAPGISPENKKNRKSNELPPAGAAS